MEKNKVNMVDAPEGHAGEGFFATKLDQVVGLARANSLWPLPLISRPDGERNLISRHQTLPYRSWKPS